MSADALTDRLWAGHAPAGAGGLLLEDRARVSAEAEAAGAVALRRRVTDLANGLTGAGTGEDGPAPERGAVLSP